MRTALRAACLCLLFLKILLAGLAEAGISALPPEKMLDDAGIIVVGTVEVKDNGSGARLVLTPEIVYRGQTGGFLLSVTLPPPGGFGQDILPPKGSRMLLLLRLNEAGRLVPVADINWAALLDGEKVTRLFLGASVPEGSEQDYIAAYNSYIAQEPGKKTSSREERGTSPNKTGRAPGEVNPAVFFVLAGLALLGILASAKRRKRALKSEQKSGKQFRGRLR